MLGKSKQGLIPPRGKDLVFLVIYMCPTVKTHESVERRAKPAVRPRKIRYPQKDTWFVNKMIIEVNIQNNFGL